MRGGAASARRASVGDARLLKPRRLIRVLQCSVWLCWRLAFSAVRRFSSESSVHSFCVSFHATFVICSAPLSQSSLRLPHMCWSVVSFPHVPLLFVQALLAAACSSGAAKGKGSSESSIQPQAQSLHSMRITRIRYTRSAIAIKSKDQSILSIPSAPPDVLQDFGRAHACRFGTGAAAAECFSQLQLIRGPTFNAS